WPWPAPARAGTSASRSGRSRSRPAERTRSTRPVELPCPDGPGDLPAVAQTSGPARGRLIRASAQRLAAAPALAGHQHHRLQHLSGFHADEPAVFAWCQVANARGELFAGAPDDGVGEAHLLDVEAAPAIDQDQRGHDIAVDAVDRAIEGEDVLVFAVQRAAIGAVLVVAALHAFKGHLCEVVDAQVGVECGGDSECTVAAVLDGEGGGEFRGADGDRQAAAEGMLPLGGAGA